MDNRSSFRKGEKGLFFCVFALVTTAGRKTKLFIPTTSFRGFALFEPNPWEPPPPVRSPPFPSRPRFMSPAIPSSSSSSAESVTFHIARKKKKKGEEEEFLLPSISLFRVVEETKKGGSPPPPLNGTDLASFERGREWGSEIDGWRLGRKETIGGGREGGSKDPPALPSAQLEVPPQTFQEQWTSVRRRDGETLAGWRGFSSIDLLSRY